MPMAIEGVARNTARGGQRDVFHLTPKIFRKIAFPPRLSLADRIIHASPDSRNRSAVGEFAKFLTNHRQRRVLHHYLQTRDLLPRQYDRRRRRVLDLFLAKLPSKRLRECNRRSVNIADLSAAALHPCTDTEFLARGEQGRRRLSNRRRSGGNKGRRKAVLNCGVSE